MHVVKTNGLDHDSLFAPPKKDGSAYLDPELITRFKSYVTAKVRRGTRLIDVSVGNRDPERAQQFAASMTKEFVSESFEQELDLSDTARNHLQQETGRLKAKLESAEQAVQKAALELNKIAIPYHALVHEVDAEGALYESVVPRMKVTNVAKGIWENKIGDLTVHDKLFNRSIRTARPRPRADLAIENLE